MKKYLIALLFCLVALPVVAQEASYVPGGLDYDPMARHMWSKQFTHFSSPVQKDFGIWHKDPVIDQETLTLVCGTEIDWIFDVAVAYPSNNEYFQYVSSTVYFDESGIYIVKRADPIRTLVVIVNCY